MITSQVPPGGSPTPTPLRAPHFKVIQEISEFLPGDNIRSFALLRGLVEPGTAPSVVDFGILFDEDCDDRILIVAQRLLFANLLRPVRFLYESQGNIVFLLQASRNAAERYVNTLLARGICDDIDGDTWAIEFVLAGSDGNFQSPIFTAIETSHLIRIARQNGLGPKPATFA